MHVSPADGRTESFEVLEDRGTTTPRGLKSAVALGGIARHALVAAAIIIFAGIVGGCSTNREPEFRSHGTGQLDPARHADCVPAGTRVLAFRSRANWRPRVRWQMPRDAHAAIDWASRRTGVSFDYLAATAYRESSFRTNVSALSSSAQGMFQFIEQTWLGLFRRDGHCLGLSRLAKSIVETGRNSLTIRSPEIRSRVLALRNDPHVAAFFAARLALDNARSFELLTGWPAGPGELYVAHFLGPSAAARLRALARHRPAAPAARYFPQAAASNRRVFFDRSTPRSALATWAFLTRTHNRI